jgi:DNA-binding transcriptional LysR family regulator
VQEVCELDELDAIVGLVAQGLGVALVPQTPATCSAGLPACGRSTWGRRPSTATSGCCTAPGALAEPVRDLIDRIRAAYGA